MTTIEETQAAIIRQARQAKRQSVEDELAYQLRVAGIEFSKQFRFCKDRRFKSDFVIFAKSGTYLIECQGATWSNGRHVRGRGYENDCRRLNVATQLGYRMMWFTSDMVHSGEAVTVIEAAVKGENG